MLEKFIIGLHLAGALGVVVLVLLQQGKGAEAGASFGAGASNTVFGGQGSSTFLSRLTAILAACFFLTSLGLGYFAKVEAHQQSDIGLPAQTLQVPTPKSAGDTPVLQGQQPANNSGAGDVPAAPAPAQK